MKAFRTLDLAIEFYQLAQKLKTPLHLRNQLDRASSSISLNLAEGNAKFSYRDKARIYQIAYGSLREFQAIFPLVGVLDPQLLAVSKHLGSSIYRLIKASLNRIEGDKTADPKPLDKNS